MNSPHWLTPLLHRFVVLAIGVSLLWTASWLLWPASGELQVILLAVLVLLLGLPHGAVDLALGRLWLAPRLGRYWFVGFNAVYLGLTALVVLAWYFAPVYCLVSMLILSALHFGLDDSFPRLANGWQLGCEVLCRGSMVIVLPVCFHPADMHLLLGYLLPTTPPEAIASGLSWVKSYCLPPLLVGLSWLLLSSLRAWHMRRSQWQFHRNLVGEVLVLLLALTLLPPLLSFVLYFCLWHSMRQCLLVAAKLEPKSQSAALRCFCQASWLPTGFVLLVTGGIWLWLPSDVELGPKTMTLVLITLLALTLPHMCLRYITGSSHSLKL